MSVFHQSEEEMKLNRSDLLFNLISPVYGLFYSFQRRHYAKILEKVKDVFDPTKYHTVLDVGSGTGALASVLSEHGLHVTGVESSTGMLKVADRQKENKHVRFLRANALERLPFEDKSFDVSFASYVAHGLRADERKHMYAEMSRVSRHLVIIHDYNENRSLITSFVEWLERGDYFRFIKVAKKEMKDCKKVKTESLAFSSCFSEVKVIDVDIRASWYIGIP